ncbi:hypothetical protein B0H13DRAFT_2578172 [Mycena leptocephala]|nr:hypothetical protein B0H13DRAFT_2578172 [Mycena leptocephala]
MDSDVGLVPDDLPSLQPISYSEDDSCDEEGDNSDAESMSDLKEVNEVHSPRARVSRTLAQPVFPPIQASKRAPAGKGKITRYWKVETAEEKAARLEKYTREYAERAEEVRQREVEEKRKQRTQDRERANERMRRHRERLREEKIADGWIPGKKRKHVDLTDHDKISAADPELPEHSRPRRQFQEDDRKNNKPCGRTPKPKNKNRVSKPWKPRAILKELHRANLKDFSRLTEQVIGRWIDGDSRDRGTSKWKDSVIQNVARGKGNAPSGHTTPFGVLHPYPATRKKIYDHLTSLRGAGVILTLLSIRGIMAGHIQNDVPELFERTMNDASHFRCSESFTRSYLRNTLGWSERRTTKAAQKLPADHEKQGTGSTWTQRGVKQVAVFGQEEKRAFTLDEEMPSTGNSAVVAARRPIAHALSGDGGNGTKALVGREERIKAAPATSEWDCVGDGREDYHRRMRMVVRKEDKVSAGVVSNVTMQSDVWVAEAQMSDVADAKRIRDGV